MPRKELHIKEKVHTAENKLVVLFMICCMTLNVFVIFLGVVLGAVYYFLIRKPKNE